MVRKHDVNMIIKHCISILIWSGSTSIGQYTISIHHHSYLKELGVDICFDYKDFNAVEK